jgi:hypothetical protein
MKKVLRPFFNPMLKEGIDMRAWMALGLAIALGVGIWGCAKKEEVTTPTEEPISITGKVVVEGKPLSGIKVEIGGLGESAQTDDKGVFVFRGVPEGSYSVLIQESGYSRFSRDVVITPGKVVDLGTIELIKLVTLQGRVVLPETDDYSDATVEVLETGDKVTTPKSGLFSIELPPGRYTIKAYKGGYSQESVDVELKPGGPIDIGDITLTRVGPVLPSKIEILAVGGSSGSAPGVDWNRLESLIPNIAGKPVSVTAIGSFADIPGSLSELKKYWVVYLGWNWANAPGDMKLSVDPAKVQAFKDYIKQGGRVATAATNDATWNPDFLPYPISILDAGDHNATITDDGAKSKLFEKPNPIDLNAVVLDDTWTNWSPEYVPFALRADNTSQADVLFAKYGDGIIVLTTLDARADSQFSAAQALIQNLIEWVATYGIK